MKCPACSDTSLLMTERAGIEIDYCPTCRGVWLDRGELDKIIERSIQNPNGEVAPSLREKQSVKHLDHEWGGSDHHGDHHREYERSRSHGRKSFWQELFD